MEKMNIGGPKNNENNLDIENSLDIGFLAKNHPNYVKANLTEEDISFLQEKTSELQKDPSITGLINTLKDLKDDEHGRVMAKFLSDTIFSHVQRESLKKKN